MRAARLALPVLLAAAAPPDLLERLRAAPDGASAGHLQAAIVAQWAEAASPAVHLLSDRADRSAAAGRFVDALNDADGTLALQPELSDLWRRRGEIRLAAGDRKAAVADFGQALAREPRNFLALADLSRAAEAAGDWSAAREAWRRFLVVDPHAPGGADRLRLLSRKADGQPT